MADSYLSISAIANDSYMIERMIACVTQERFLKNPATAPQDALSWVQQYRYAWASSPSWGEKWTYALETHLDDPDYEPGKDEAVITDGDILATVQHLTADPALAEA